MTCGCVPFRPRWRAALERTDLRGLLASAGCSRDALELSPTYSSPAAPPHPLLPTPAPQIYFHASPTAPASDPVTGRREGRGGVPHRGAFRAERDGESGFRRRDRGSGREGEREGAGAAERERGRGNADGEEGVRESRGEGLVSRAPGDIFLAAFALCLPRRTLMRAVPPSAASATLWTTLTRVRLSRVDGACSR